MLSPQLSRQLAEATFSPAWWNLPEAERFALMENYAAAESELDLDPGWTSILYQAVTKYNKAHSAATGQFISGGGGGYHAAVVVTDDIDEAFNQPWAKDYIEANAQAIAHGPGSEEQRDYENKYGLDKLGQTDRKLEVIAKEQEFMGKPEVVSVEQLDKHIQDGDTEMFRGFGTEGRAPHHIEEFKNGEYYATQGSFGSGIYAAHVQDAKSPESWQKAQRMAEGYCDDADTGAVRMSLRKDANVVTDRAKFLKEYQRDIEKIENKMWDLKDAGQANSMDSYRLRAKLDFITDPGRYAAIRGYDAILTDKGVAAIFNRTAIRVQDITGLGE